MSVSRVPSRLFALGFACATLALPGRSADTPSPSPSPIADAGRLVLRSDPAARYRFGGSVASRLDANLEHWLLRAPQANPGMLGMFGVRDRKPVPQLVPWAGEFVGKYLLSAIQALRLTDDPRLRQQVSHVVTAFIASQAEDGYLGPFPKDIRLLKNWDLWGHYHAIQALLAWHEQTGDPAALAAARRAGDLACRTFLGTGRRVYDAGDPEMNMAILTGLAMLHRATGEPRYLALVREVEKDWERAGDYLRAGLDGREFFQSPRPRWESLHDLQGLAELWRITGEAKYREAFIHHWRSIRRWDRRNTGGFSSGEQATGNPYANTAIETCCTVAWMALTVDYLRLTGDPLAADELELSTLNGGLGAQHPSGRWWTYNTPMDGVREASAHTIVFQSRAGTPELNCCSVNAPRVLGVLSEWAVMTASDGVTVNWLGPLTASTQLPDGKALGLEVAAEGADGPIRVRVSPATDTEFTLRIRVPGWTGPARFATTGSGTALSGEPQPGTYLELRRRWAAGDTVVLTFPRPIRWVAGANEAAGKVALYRGPTLLAYDQHSNAFDPDGVPPVDLARLDQARVITHPEAAAGLVPGPWLNVDLPAADGSTLHLVDFANAGSTGTPYRSWLPATPTPPAPAFGHFPADGQRLPPGPTEFRWRHRATVSGPRPEYLVQLSRDPAFRTFASFPQATPGRNRMTVDTKPLLGSTGDGSEALYWRVAVTIAGTSTIIQSDAPPARLVVDQAAAAQVVPPEPKIGPAGEVIRHSLRDDRAPAFGTLEAAQITRRTEEGTSVASAEQRLTYALAAWPEEDFTVAVRVRIQELPRGRIGQVFSAWTSVGDDPLRLVVDGGKLFARTEAGGNFSTPGVPVETGRWLNLAAVRQAGRLTLFVDGRAAGAMDLPALVNTQSRACALGGNPRYGGDEHLAATFADFALWARALTPEELAAPRP